MITREITRKVSLNRYREGNWQQTEDIVVEETPVTIYLNERELVTLLCTPARLDHLAVGFLFSEGLITGKEDIMDLEVDQGQGLARVETVKTESLEERLFGRRMVTSGCGKGTIFYSAIDSLRKKIKGSPLPAIDPEQAFMLMHKLQERAELFRETGGVHSCALAKGSELFDFCEDIGRHNAVDKLLGKALMDGVPLEGTLLLTSGRITSEILLKAARAGIKTIISRAAPTALALELAQDLQVRVIGFTRGRRLNDYSQKG